MSWTPLLWKVLVAAALLAVFAVLGSWLQTLARTALERSGLDPAIRRLLVRVVRPLALLIGVITAVQILNVDLTPVTAMLGAATLAVGLALRGSLSNVASGAMLLTLRPYHEGDLVEVHGQTGTVLEQGLFTVTLQTVGGVMITIPNDTAFQSAIHNLSRTGQRRLELQLTLTQEADLPLALRLLTEAAQAEERVLAEPAPSTLVLDITPRGPMISLRAWTATPDLIEAKSALAITSLSALAAAGVPIAPAPR